MRFFSVAWLGLQRLGRGTFAAVGVSGRGLVFGSVGNLGALKALSLFLCPSHSAVSSQVAVHVPFAPVQEAA